MCALLSPLLAAAVLLGSLTAAGCSFFSPSLQPLAETPQGAVWIESLSERGSTMIWTAQARGFRATHPALLNAQLIADILGGLRLQARPEHPPAQPRLDPRAVAVFTDDEQAFLAPAIAQALSRLAPNQRVMFQVRRHGARETEFTTGTLFVRRPTIHITLRHFRVTSPDGSRTGLEGQELAFVRQEALMVNQSPQAWSLAEPRRPTASVNYEIMDMLTSVEPARATQGVNPDRPPAPAQADELQGMKEVLSQQEKDLATLREEMKSMRQRLTEKDSPPATSKPIRKPAP
jgi:uncharacterized coiled-coil protein SlyX